MGEFRLSRPEIKCWNCGRIKVLLDDVDWLKYICSGCGEEVIDPKVTVCTHTNFDEMDEETKAAFSRMVEAAIEYLKKGIAP